jgi:ABC-type lipoprotein release transport system permease subunit
MTIHALIRRNLLHFWRTNLAVVVGVGVAVAVLAGALLVGSSVRASLQSLALERLGSVDTVVTSASFVQESLAEKVLDTGSAREWFGGVAPIIAVEGFVTHQESGRRASGVQVYGVDERFWDFHEQNAESLTLERNRVFVSEGLASELGVTVDDSVLVRVELPSAIPISSLHGRRDDLGRTLRLGIERVLPPEAEGEFSFRPQQGRARSVFVSLTRLQQALEQEGRVNTVLLGVGNLTSGGSVEMATRLTAAESAVRAAASLEDIGLRVRVVADRNELAVEAVGGLVNETTAQAVGSVAEASGIEMKPVLTYLVNKLIRGDRIMPYSLVSAIDLELVSDQLGDFTNSENSAVPLVLNEWAADDLNVSEGDFVEFEYFVWEDEGRLVTHDASFRVADVVPIAGAAGDSSLAPDYPGITEAVDLTGWDPPFEIDLGLIRPQDEDYWDEYRTTPKAFIPLETGQQLWESRWGSLTSIRLKPTGDLEVAAEQFGRELLAAVDPVSTGFVVYPARALAVESSVGATDFGLYFIYFSFFLVVSALLLASLFFRLGVEQRLAEIGLLRAAGFSDKTIWKIFSREALLLSVMGSLIGVVGAVVYAELIMWGLRTWWVDAVGTTRLTLFVSPVALMSGALGGVIAAFLSIALTLRSLSPVSPRSLLSGILTENTFSGNTGSRSRLVTLAVGLFCLGIGLIVASTVDLLTSTVGFFGGGISLLCSLLVTTSVLLRGGYRRQTGRPWSIVQVGFRNASARPGRSVLCIALIASAAFIIVAVDAFHREGAENELNPQSGTGGYPLLADTLLPIAHDLSVAAGQDALNLFDFYESGGVLEGVTFTRFRLRPGEDASCLNLYQAKDPRILAATETFLSEGRFSFAGSLAETEVERENPWQLLHRTFEDGAIPAIADATSLTYALHLKVGDDFVLNRDTDNPIRLRIVAALSDSIFQRELMVSEEHFDRFFPHYEGYRFFLIDTPLDRTDEVTAALEGRLSDYGFDVVSTAERLAGFHRVENTYLATFQALGGLGLVLGTFGLGAVLLRNVFERRRELALLRAVGFNSRHLSLLVLSENAFLLLVGLFAGTVSALVAIAPAWVSRGGSLPFLSLGSLLVIVLVAGFSASVFATLSAVRAPLLSSLRSE